MSTPVKTPRPFRSHSSEIFRVSENSDPNLPIPSTPSHKPIKSPAIKSSAKSKKTAPKTPQNPNRIQCPPPPPPPRERKFIVAKKKSRKGGKKDLDSKKCQQSAYEALRASQEDFFKKDLAIRVTREGVKDGVEKDRTVGDEMIEKLGVQETEGSSVVRKEKSLVLEEALSSIPEPGSGRVKHLVKAFESLLSISEEPEANRVGERKPRVMDWALPGLQQSLMKGLENDVEVASSVEFFPLSNFERDSRLYSSMDSNGDRLSWGSQTSSGSRRSRRNSSDSSRRSWNKKLKVTSQQPFKLRTEQRGRLKEENFLNKVKELFMEEEKKRIPIAQGLPWTTDEPECLVKPPVKESTEPVDLVLHSDIRAVDRAEFDHYVAERLSFVEQIKLERERQQKLEEEEEIRRLRRELVPRAQPMPYFDEPFIPKKSTRPRTVPKEPRFHIRSMKSSCVSLLGR